MSYRRRIIFLTLSTRKYIVMKGHQTDRIPEAVFILTCTAKPGKPNTRSCAECFGKEGLPDFWVLITEFPKPIMCFSYNSSLFIDCLLAKKLRQVQFIRNNRNNLRRIKYQRIEEAKIHWPLFPWSMPVILYHSLKGITIRWLPAFHYALIYTCLLTDAWSPCPITLPILWARIL